MHSLPIQPLAHPPQATVRVPGSKSLTNRALLVAALANGQTRLSNALFSDDSAYFTRALSQLGFTVILDENQEQMTVLGLGGRIPADKACLFIGNAGTAARFLTAMLTLGRGEYLLDGDERMRQRPMSDLVAALSQLGARITPVDETSGAELRLPLRILAEGLPGGTARISGKASSQFLSGLLMSAPYASQPVEILVEDELSSKPYVDLTLQVIADFGVLVERQGYERFTVRPQCYLPQAEYSIESDASAASYFFAVPAICGGKVQVANIALKSIQGDLAFLKILAKMGCTIQETDHGITVQAGSALRGVDVDLRDSPDTAQTLAAIAPFASTPTTIRGIASARRKESDRVADTCRELARLGVQVEELPDGMTIQPCANLQPASIHTYQDHRMAMAFALVGLRVPGVSIQDPECVSKTFPRFFQVLESLRHSGQ